MARSTVLSARSRREAQRRIKDLLPNVFSFEEHPREPGRAGVPMEVMGLMLGEFVDDYTARTFRFFLIFGFCLVQHSSRRAPL